MKTETMIELSSADMSAVAGGGLMYELGAFFAKVANANDAIYDAYGNTNRNHWQSTLTKKKEAPRASLKRRSLYEI